MMTKVIDTCWLIIKRDETYFIHMHLLILLHKFIYSLMHGYGTLIGGRTGKYLININFF
jgi:hypothetical protein